MPRMVFQFGIEPYFSINFQLGSLPECACHDKAQRERDPEPILGLKPAQCLKDGTSTVASHHSQAKSLKSDPCSENRVSKPVPKVTEIVTDSFPTEVIDKANLSPCGRLSVLPVELRMIIYEMLLVSEAPIRVEDACELIGLRESLVKSKLPRMPAIDARLLRTCRTVYKEALPVLYQQNTYYFSTPSLIVDFMCEPWFELFSQKHTKRLFGYTSKRHGRLSLIRSIILDMGGEGFSKDRSYLTARWARFLDEPGKSHGIRQEFPALEKLTLDLSAWHPGPGEEEALNVQPLVRKFRRPEGLQELVVIGLNDQSNLNDLSGLVREGGRFYSHGS